MAAAPVPKRTNHGELLNENKEKKARVDTNDQPEKDLIDAVIRRKITPIKTLKSLGEWHVEVPEVDVAEGKSSGVVERRWNGLNIDVALARKWKDDMILREAIQNMHDEAIRGAVRLKTTCRDVAPAAELRWIRRKDSDSTDQYYAILDCLDTKRIYCLAQLEVDSAPKRTTSDLGNAAFQLYPEEDPQMVKSKIKLTTKITLTNYGATMGISAMKFGGTDKGQDNQIGEKGSGLKFMLAALIKRRKPFWIKTPEENMMFCEGVDPREESKGKQCLISRTRVRSNIGVQLVMWNLKLPFDTQNFMFLPQSSYTCSHYYGHDAVIVSGVAPGRIYKRGIYVTTVKSCLFAYNLHDIDVDHTKNMVSTNQLVECLEVLWTGLLKLKHDRSSLVFYKALFTCRPEKLESCLEVQAITNGGVLTLEVDEAKAIVKEFHADKADHVPYMTEEEEKLIKLMGKRGFKCAKQILYDILEKGLALSAKQEYEVWLSSLVSDARPATVTEMTLIQKAAIPNMDAVNPFVVTSAHSLLKHGLDKQHTKNCKVVGKGLLINAGLFNREYVHNELKRKFCEGKDSNCECHVAVMIDEIRFAMKLDTAHQIFILLNRGNNAESETKRKEPAPVIPSALSSSSSSLSQLASPAAPNASIPAHGASPSLVIAAPVATPRVASANALSSSVAVAASPLPSSMLSAPNIRQLKENLNVVLDAAEKAATRMLFLF